MANLPEKKEWKGVYQWETSDRALGGPDSQFTKPIRDLADRTAYLKEQVEKGNKDLVEHSKSTDHPEASTTQKGFVQLSSAVNNTNEGVAATSKAVKIVYDLAASKANSTHTHSEYASANHNHPFNQITGVPTASTSVLGIVKLNNTTNSTSQTEAATANTIKTVYDLAASKANSSHTHSEYALVNHSHTLPTASTSASGIVKLNTAINSSSTNEAATPSAVKQTYDLANRKAEASHSHGFNQITGTPTATTSVLGITKLNNAVNSNSTTEAATPSAVKAAYDLATSKVNSVNGQTGTVTIYDVPVGIPQPWPSSQPPTGWLKCNGASFDRNQYPLLAKVYQNGVLPDLRGEFIRGWDDGRGIDPGRGIATWQNDSFKSHNHGLYGIRAGASNIYSSGSSNRAPGTINSNNTGDTETRPRNIAFLYIVRAA